MCMYDAHIIVAPNGIPPSETVGKNYSPTIEIAPGLH